MASVYILALLSIPTLLPMPLSMMWSVDVTCAFMKEGGRGEREREREREREYGFEKVVYMTIHNGKVRCGIVWCDPLWCD